jgi:hypothetical protein
MNRIRIWFSNLRVDSFAGALLLAVIGFLFAAWMALCAVGGGW